MKFFFSFVGIVLLILITFILIWRGMTGDGPVPEAPAPLSDYTFTGVMMRFTVVGQVNQQEDHRGMRMTVSRSESRLEVLEGYDRTITESRSYASNQEAYATFLRALDKQGFTQGNDDPELRDDRGFCPRGRRFIYEIVDGNEVIQRYWSTSCGRSQGTFEGNGGAIERLFRAQIPDYRELTRGVRL